MKIMNYIAVLSSIIFALTACNEKSSPVLGDDDLGRTVRFGGQANDNLWHEEAGTIEIPLIFENGASMERMISGKLFIDSLFGGCTEADFVLETTEFSTAGDETLKVKVMLKDNDTLGDWGFRLNFRDLRNVQAVSKSYEVNVKDDERILGFSEKTYEVNEGSSLSLQVMMKGGTARDLTPLVVEVIEDGTTALPEQYTFPTSITPISAGEASQTISLATHRHPTRNDLKLKIKISTTIGATSPGKILADESSVCEVIIRNIDRFVAFKTSEFAGIYEGTCSVPIVSSGFDQDVVAHVKIKSSNLGVDGCELISSSVTIPAGMKSGSVQLKLNEAPTPDTRIVLEIETLIVGQSEDNSLLDPDRFTCICKVPDMAEFSMARVDRKGR